ncbi:hypothetical protein [Mycobacterium avium]|nr:hypothetical protein [Mycobacterium avium]
MGARVTILSDANYGVHNPVDIRNAGRVYQHAHVACRGAFHPKLAVLVGEHDVWVAIGSGNPTTAGWGHNDELWLVISSARRSGPLALVQLGAWLRALATHPSLWLPSWIAATLVQIADMITPAIVDDSTPDLQILGNLDQPLVQQLPGGPVTSLHLTAPFFDRQAAAVRALIAQMRPESVIIGVQPSLSSYDGAALVAAAESASRSQFRHLSENGHRISHGKLVEWATGGAMTAMIGSPNISRAALLAATADGGNCELAVIHPITQSLLPQGVSAAPHVVRARCTLPTVEQVRRETLVTLLGARRINTGIHVEVRTTAPATLTIELSSSAAPGQWWPRHQLEVTDADIATVVSAHFPAPETAGTAVRVIAQSGDTRCVSSVVFLTDTARCQPRSAQAGAPRLRRDYTDIFTDPELLARFERDLYDLLRANAAHRHTRPPTHSTPRPTVDDSDRWGGWLNDVETTLGLALTTGLFPAAGAGAGTPCAPTVWTVDVDDKAAAADVDDENDPDIETEANDLADRRQPPDIPAEERRRWRLRANRLRRLATTTPAPGVELRMLVTQLHLDLLAGGVWGPHDDWADSFAEVLTAMPPTDADDMPERGHAYVGGLVAVGLALLGQDATLHGGRPEDLTLQHTWDAIGKWATHADPDLIDHYLYQPTQTYSRAADRGEVEAVIALAGAARDDPHARLRAALNSDGIDANIVDGVWVADCGSAQPRRYAARIGTLIDRHTDRYAVIARGDRGSCVLLCHKATLAIAESTTRIWRVFTKRSMLSTPASMLAEGLPTGMTFPRTPAAPPPEVVAALASAIGVEVADLTASLHGLS